MESDEDGFEKKFFILQKDKWLKKQLKKSKAPRNRKKKKINKSSTVEFYVYLEL